MTQSPPNRPASPLTPARLWALVPCAGAGSRAGAASPKQYQPVAGKPLVMHTLAAFGQVQSLERVLVVVAPDDEFLDSAILSALGSSVPLSIAHCGGATRALSVQNGLNALLEMGGAPHDWVLVHDAARCLITPAQIKALIDACQGDEVGGLLAHRLADTLKSGQDGRVVGTISRADKWLAQTPQMFRVGPLLAALAQAGAAVTDESSAMEAMRLRAKLVDGSAQNFKVTYPEDFALAAAVLASRQHLQQDVSGVSMLNADAKPGLNANSKNAMPYDYP